MCGITFVHRKDEKKANKAVFKRYVHQKNRGSDGFGYLAIKKSKMKSYKRAKLESEIKKMLDNEDSETIIFHHRYPTSTPNFKESAHPIKVSNIDLKYDYYLVHNGIINNAYDLKTKHEDLGFEYNTEIIQKWVTSGQTYKEECFNDSESLAIEVALAIDKNDMRIEAKGSIAFIVAQVEKSNNKIVGVYFARNEGNPLKINIDKHLISIGSESEGTIIPANILHKLDLKTNDITEHAFSMPAYHGYNFGYDLRGESKSEYRGTTFGDIDDIDCDDPRDYCVSWVDDKFDYELSENTIDEKVKERWNSIDWEIIQYEARLDVLESNNDGSPESENSIIECEAILDSLYKERGDLDGMITKITLAQ